jgi:pteridine reductase
LAPEIRVNSIAPGPIIWPDSKQPFDENYKQIVIKQTLLKRTGEPNDIAQAVEFILAANYITGHNLKVDGGRSIST